MFRYVFDIYEQIWEEDESNFGPIEDVYLMTYCFELQKNKKQILNDIYNIIGQEKGDGFLLNVNSFNEVTFIRVDLFSSRDYSYILDYLEANGELIDYPEISIDYSLNLIQLSDYDEELAQLLVSSLKLHLDEEINVIQSDVVFEKGASHWAVDFLIWSSSIPASMIASYMYNFLKERKINKSGTIKVIEQFENESIKRKASELSEVNINDLTIIGVKHCEYEQTTTFKLTSRYNDIIMIYSNEQALINYELNKKSQLKI